MAFALVGIFFGDPTDAADVAVGYFTGIAAWVIGDTTRGQRERAAQSGKEKLTMKPRGKAMKRLNRRGTTKVNAEVTYAPDGGTSNTKSKSIKLVKG